jgi:hypothetical protein
MTLSAKKSTVLSLLTNSELRQKWDTTLEKFEFKNNNRDWSKQRIRFVFKPPMMTVSV